MGNSDRIKSMAGEFYLEKEPGNVPEEFHRACLDKRTADRIKAIPLIAGGFTCPQIEKILLSDGRTLNRYKKIYIEQGIDGLAANNYQGRQCKIKEEQIKMLKSEPGNRLYGTAESVCDYAFRVFGIRYTARGMVQTLHRPGYSYKKTVTAPGKFDPDKQKGFAKTYKRRYKNLPKGEKVYFMDGSRPAYNSHAGYGWIAVGKRHAVKSPGGRKRLNLMGAYEPKGGEPTACGHETLNRESAIHFLRHIRARNKHKKVRIICDNARYQHAKAARETAEELGIRMVYLPGYSPNLNLIERYWGCLKKKVLVNKHHETFEQFRDAIITFTKCKSKKLKKALLKYIPEKFHLLEPAPS